MSKPRNERLSQTSDQRMLARSDAAARALRALIRDAYLERFGSTPPQGPWELELKLSVDPVADWAVTFSPSLPEQFLPHFETLEAGWGAYAPGRAYCFRCERSDCVHSRPAHSREIFAGYDPLGSPIWTELAAYLLATGNERVDQLYGPRPSLCAFLVEGRELKQHQLASFGKASKTYALLGQVMLGYFPLPATGKLMGEMGALTFQAVEVRDAAGRPRLELNTLYALPDGLELSDLLTDRLAWVPRARETVRAAFEKISGNLARLKGPAAREQLRQVPDLLRKFSKELERGQRQSERQTDHARDRQELLQRPVDKAMADLRETKPDRFFLDAKTKTIVVYADKGRCHIFSEAGKHVTSFVIQMEAVRLRLRKRRWIDLEPEQLNRFMQAVGHGC